MKSVATFINESEPERLPEEDYGDSVWSERKLHVKKITFPLEHQLFLKLQTNIDEVSDNMHKNPLQAVKQAGDKFLFKAQSLSSFAVAFFKGVYENAVVVNHNISVIVDDC